MKTRKIFTRCLASGMILSSLSLVAQASTPPTEIRIECGMPLEVYEATSNPSPDGVAYDYIVDENGYYILVDENENPLPLDEEMTYNSFGQLGQFDCGMPYDVYESTSNPSPEGTVYEYTTDENGNFVLVEESGSTTQPSTGSADTSNSDTGFSSYWIDEDGNYVPMQESETMDLTEAFDPEGEPIPEGTFASPIIVTPESSSGNWLAQLLTKIMSIFS